MKNILVLLFMAALPALASAQKKQSAAAATTGLYPNIFKAAGYSQQAIDAKVAEAYSDLFEGKAGIYFEVGDSMAYVSGIENKEARPEVLSYGTVVAVQLDKKDVFGCIWRWSKKCTHRALLSGGTYASADIKDKSKVRLISLSCGSKENPDGVKKAAGEFKTAGFNALSYVSDKTAHEFLT